MYLSEAPSHRTVSRFHYCAYGPAATQTLIKTHTHQDMQFDTYDSPNNNRFNSGTTSNKEIGARLKASFKEVTISNLYILL